jgi:hypothetical protein
MIITTGRQGEQLHWSELWTRFSARTIASDPVLRVPGYYRRRTLNQGQA